jgi:hypothetical protein
MIASPQLTHREERVGSAGPPHRYRHLMPLSKQQQVVTAHFSNGTYVQALDKLMAHIESLPPCRILAIQAIEPRKAPIIEAAANAIIAVVEFIVEIDAERRFPPRVSI